MGVGAIRPGGRPARASSGRWSLPPFSRPRPGSSNRPADSRLPRAASPRASIYVLRGRSIRHERRGTRIPLRVSSTRAPGSRDGTAPGPRARPLLRPRSSCPGSASAPATSAGSRTSASAARPCACSAMHVATGLDAYNRADLEQAARRYARWLFGEVRRLYLEQAFDVIVLPSDTFFYVRSLPAPLMRSVSPWSSCRRRRRCPWVPCRGTAKMRRCGTVHLRLHDGVQ